MSKPNAKGYLRIGGKYAHRVAYFEAHPEGPYFCNWCQRLLRREAGHLDRDAVIVDHLDHDREHNVPENLVSSCRQCNTKRQNRERGQRL